MKTYDIYGARPPADTTGLSTTEIALLVQRALHVDMLARAERPASTRHYSHTEREDAQLREEFVLANVASSNGMSPYPDFDFPVIVGVGNPANPYDEQAILEGIGLTLLRRRRREYARTLQEPLKPMLELYGIQDTAASVVTRLSPMLGMAFDGNEHASVGADSHYYDESEHFGTILVFDNVAGPFDNLPFPKFAAFPAVLLAVNPPRTGELRRLLLQHGFAALNQAEPEIQP